MPKVSGQKKKLLLIKDYLMERTDENHSVTISNIIAYLSQNGISAGYQSVKDDIELLSDSGMDISLGKDINVISRDFELPELKFLIDCVQTSKCITEKNTEDLTNKRCNLCSRYEAESLRRMAHVSHVKGTKLYVSAIAKKIILDFALVLDDFLVFISKSPLCMKFIETKRWQYRVVCSVLPQTKAI